MISGLRHREIQIGTIALKYGQHLISVLAEKAANWGGTTGVYSRGLPPLSRTSAAYRSIWPESLAQLEEIFFRISTSAELFADFINRLHSAA